MTQQEQVQDMTKSGCFVSVHVKRPTLRTSLTWKELGLPELDEALVTPPSTRPPSKAYNTFSTLESRMRTCLKRHSAGSAGGFRFMKYANLAKFNEEIGPLQADYDACVDPFLESYDQTVSDALALWEQKANDIYDSLKSPALERGDFCRRIATKLRRAWPDSESLKNRFSVEVQVLQFTMPDQDVYEVDTDLIAEARQKAKDTLDGFFVGAQNELRTRAIETVRRMHDALAKGSTVTERSVKPLREFAEQFRELSVSSDEDFQGQLDGLVKAIDNRGGAEGLRNDKKAWAQVQDMLGEVAEAGEKLVQDALRRDHNLDRKISI